MQGQEQPAVGQVGRRILDTSQREGLDGAVTNGHHAVDQHRLEEPLGLEIVRQVIGVIERHVAAGAGALAEEDGLPPQLGRRRLLQVELP